METDDGNPPLRAFLVECYVPGIQAFDVAADGDRAQAAADRMRREGHRIEYVRGLVLPVDEVVFHLFLAQDAGLVREAILDAAVTCERIVESIVVEAGLDARRVPPHE